MTLIALIPARSGSKRIPNKNIRPFFGHPLIAYAIQSAIDSKIFEWIYVSTDSDEIGQISAYYGANWIKRPEEFAKDTSPDVEWITHALRYSNCDAFMILRPTSPFRTSETIKRAWKEWDKGTCLKAIQKVTEHPGKMWRLINFGSYMMSFFSKNILIPDYSHLESTQTLEEIYIQNASLECRPIDKANGKDFYYQPFFTKGYEGFDLNDMDDLILAEALVEKGLVKLPKIEREPYEK